MLGAKTDVLGGTIQQAALGDGPENRFVTKDNHLGFVDVVTGDNRQAILASRRNIPFLLASHPQGPRVRLQNQEEQVFSSGGLAVIPPEGIWRGVK